MLILSLMCNQCFRIEDSFLKVNQAMIMCFKEKQRCCKTHDHGMVHLQKGIFNAKTLITHQ